MTFKNTTRNILSAECDLSTELIYSPGLLLDMMILKINARQHRLYWRRG